MKKIVFLAAAVFLVAAGCNSSTTATTSMQSSAPQVAGATVTATPTAMPTVAAAATSNAALDASLGNIDSQMNGLSADAANTSSSANAEQAP